MRRVAEMTRGDPTLISELPWGQVGSEFVRLFPEPATDRVDQYGRLLRYVVRVEDGLNVNVQLVRVGAAAPYFYEGRRGRYAALLERLALRARARKLGLWGRCPHTLYDPTRGVSTRR
jgi:endonuclease YncB( thermonuclease family)